jgi:glucokinase
MKERQKLPVLAIDIGGTKIIAAIISSKGKIVAKEYHPTLAGEGVQAIIGWLFSAIDNLLKKNNIDPSQLHSISIAAAGAIDSGRGVITFSPNLPGWYDVPLRDIVNRKYKVNTFLINDANAAALGNTSLVLGRG